MQQYLQMMGMDERMYRGYMRPSAAAELRTELLLEKVAEAEKVEVSAEEIEAEYKSSAEKFGVELEEMKKSVPEDVVAQDLKNRKAIDIICDSGIATDKPEEPEESEDKTDAENTPAEEKGAGQE